MSNSNITQRGTQASADALLIANIGDPIFILRMLAIPFSGTQMAILGTTPTKDLNGKHRLGKTTNCYFRSNPTQRGYRKRMMEIWQEHSNFQITSRRLADQVRTIIKKGWFSDLEILENTPENK